MLIDIDEQQQAILLNIARKTIVYGCVQANRLPCEQSWLSHTALQQRVSTFVTLTKTDSPNKKQLRGCMGAIMPSMALAEDVVCHAYAAAFQDRRFPKVQEQEVNQLHIDISIISPLTQMMFTSEADLLQQLQINVDGLLIKSGGQQAIFLPSVWEQLPEKESFLRHLKEKAGFSENYWSNDVEAFRYTTIYIEE